MASRPLVRGIGASRDARGQASLMVPAAVGVLLAGALVLFAFGNALGAKGRYQRAADLAAVSAAQVMRDLYPRLFEPPFLEPDASNPRHLEQEAYVGLAREAAVRGRAAKRCADRRCRGQLPDGGFAPTRVTVRVRGDARVRVGEGRRAKIPVRASATAELTPGAGPGLPTTASGGGYDGPLAYRQGKPTCCLFPRCRAAFRRCAPASRGKERRPARRNPARDFLPADGRSLKPRACCSRGSSSAEARRGRAC